MPDTNRDDNGYRPGINGTKMKHLGGGFGQVFYPATDQQCSWETEFERKQREKQEREQVDARRTQG